MYLNRHRAYRAAGGSTAWLLFQPGASSLGQTTFALPLLMLVLGQPALLPETPRRARAVRHSPTSFSL